MGPSLRPMNASSLSATAAALVARGKGLLAADESFPTIGKRFTPLHIESNEPNRRAYRDLLFTTPDLEKYISGVILFDETIRQRSSTGKPFPELLAERGIIPGIKVDKGAVDLPNFPREKMTEGLDELRSRLEEYTKLGARFAKWRAVLTIDEHLPSETAMRANAESLAIYAALCQEAGLVPIVEPEALMDGDHSIARCEDVIETTLRHVFSALVDHGVRLEEMLLKTGMVLAGTEAAAQPAPDEVASATMCCLRRVVPAAVPGIVFLSGGQSPEQATERLAAINQIPDAPWPLTFSYGRALQDEPLEAWHGDPAKVRPAQEALRACAERNSAAAVPKGRR